MQERKPAHWRGDCEAKRPVIVSTDGTEAGMETCLVLTGVTTRDAVARFPYQPAHVVESVADIEL